MKNLHKLAFGLCFAALAFESSFAVAASSNMGPNDTYTYLRCFYREDPFDNTNPKVFYKWALANGHSTGCDDNSADSGACYEVVGKWRYPVQEKSNMFYTDMSQDALRSVCEQTLKKYPETANKQVVMFAAGDKKQSTHYTIWSNDSSAQSDKLNKIIVFGDSLSDTHNMYNHSDWLLPNGNNYFAGRFSNGKNWIDYFSEAMNLPVYNWAVGAASAENQYGVISGIGAQADSWVEFMNLDCAKNSSCQNSSQGYAKNYNAKNSLFTVLIGANDLISYCLTPLEIINKEEAALKTFIEHGGRHVLLLSLPDVSRAPAFDKNPGPVCGNRQQVGERVKEYNKLLLEMVAYLDKFYNLPPPEGQQLGVDFQVFDTYTMFSDMLNHYSDAKYGFTNVKDSCINLAEYKSSNYIETNGIRLSCAIAPTMANSFVFWDLLHPTEHAYHKLADGAYCFAKEKFGSELPAPNPNVKLPAC